QAGRATREPREQRADLAPQLAEGVHQVLEDRARLLDGAREAFLEALPDLLDAIDDLVERDQKALESLVLGAVELFARGPREAALLEELLEAVEEEAHPLADAPSEVGDAADVALERHHEAGHDHAEHRDDQDGRQQRRED